METIDLNQIIDLNESIESLKAREETARANLSIEEAMREAFSKDLTPKILRRRVRHKRVNGVKEAFTEVTIDETVLNDLVSVATCKSRIKENYDKLQTLGAKLKHETSQTELYKRCAEAEALIKQLKHEKMLLEYQIKDLERDFEKMQTQGTEPYIDFGEQTLNLEI